MMKTWDYVMPHRLLINKSLREESEVLRNRVESYQVEYDRKIKECQEKIEETEKEREKQYEQIMRSLTDELKVEEEYLDELANDVTTYTDAYLQRKHLYKMNTLKRKLMAILQEDNAFLSEQMRLVGEEVELLRDRQNELALFAKVDDIIRLSFSSGLDLFNPEDDAESLLDKVSAAIRGCDDSKSAERFALIRLKRIVQERSEYLSTIKYVSWVIQQKILFSKQLVKKRNGVRDDLAKIREDIMSIEEEIKTASIILEELAEKIRYYWAIPLTYVNADIDYSYKELSEMIVVKKDTQEELQEVKKKRRNFADLHMDDQDEWETLTRKRDNLSAEVNTLKREIGDLKRSIASKKAERERLFEIRNYYFQLFKKNGLSLIPEQKVNTDEDRIIDKRLIELQEIRRIGSEEAERICAKERMRINSDYNISRLEFESKLSELLEQMSAIVEEYEVTESRVATAEQSLKDLKKQDNRFFFRKVLSDTPQLDRARKALQEERAALAELEKKKRATEQAINEINEKLSALEKQLERALYWCRPKYLRPTAEESREEKVLLFRKEEIEKRRKEKSHESES